MIEDDLDDEFEYVDTYGLSEGWVNFALCTDHPDHLYWTSNDYEEIKLAKDGCSRCEVRLECLTHAVMNPDDFIGVRGGLSEYDFLLRTWKEVENEDDDNWDFRPTPEMVSELFGTTL